MILETSGLEEIGFDASRLQRALRLIRDNAATETSRGAYPGAVVVIVRKGTVAVCEAYGYRSLEPTRKPMTCDTIFDIASISKPIATTTALLQLVERGDVLLEDPVGRYLPTFKTTSRSEIRIVHLLTHTSGLPGWLPVYNHGESREELVEYVLSLEPQYSPGEKVEYSCMGFIVLGLLIEVVTGERLNAFVRREIIDKLGMKETGFYTVEPCPDLERIAPTEKRVACERGKELLSWLKRTGLFLSRHDDGSIACGAVHDENALAMGGVSGNAGLFSTAMDVARFALMYLGGGSFEGQRILAPATVELATRNYTLGCGDNRGLGWQLKGPRTSFGDLISDRAYGHTGFTGTSLWIDPERDLVIILLTNRVHTSRENERLLDLRPRFVNAVVSAIVR